MKTEQQWEAEVAEWVRRVMADAKAAHGIEFTRFTADLTRVLGKEAAFAMIDRAVEAAKKGEPK